MTGRLARGEPGIPNSAMELPYHASDATQLYGSRHCATARSGRLIGIASRSASIARYASSVFCAGSDGQPLSSYACAGIEAPWNSASASHRRESRSVSMPRGYCRHGHAAGGRAAVTLTVGTRA